MFESVDLPSKSRQIPVRSDVRSPLELGLAVATGGIVTFHADASYAKNAPEGAETARIPVTVRRLDKLEPTKDERDYWKGDPEEFYFEGIAGENAITKPGIRVAGCCSTKANTAVIWRLTR